MSAGNQKVTLKDGGLIISSAQLRTLGLKEKDLFTLSSMEEGVFLLQRVQKDQEEMPEEGKKMTVRGNLERFSLADMISLLHINRKTGILHISLPDAGASKSVYFKGGEVVFASSSLAEDRLGESLRRAGKVSSAQLEEAVKEASPRKKIGKILVDMGAITPKELWLGVQQQTEEIVRSLFRYTRGIFMFFEGGLEQENIVTFSLRTQDLIMEGIRRIDEWALFIEKIPNGEVILLKRDQYPEVELIPQEKSILAHVDGVRTVKQICDISGIGEFETYKTLYHLLQAGFLSVGEKEIPKEAVRGWTLDRCRVALEKMNSLFMEIYSLIRVKAPDMDARASLNSFFTDLSGDSARVFKGLTINEQGGLDTSTIMKRIEAFSGDERGPVFLNALNELLYFELFELKHYLKKEEAEELVEIIKMMQSGQ